MRNAQRGSMSSKNLVLVPSAPASSGATSVQPQELKAATPISICAGLIFAILSGIRDSLFGAIRVFLLDGKQLAIWRYSAGEAQETRRDVLLRRESADRSRAPTPNPVMGSSYSNLELGSNEPDWMAAKRRALERREQTQQALAGQSVGRSQLTRRSKTSPTKNDGRSILELTLKCSVWNLIVCVGAICAIDQVIPLVGDDADPEEEDAVTINLKFVVSVLFNTLWVIPYYFLTRAVNVMFFQDIAILAFKTSQCRAQMMRSMPIMIADTILAFFIECIFLCQAKAGLVCIPGGIGYIFYIIHMSLLNALYCFEYKWFNQGIELFRRLDYIERNWAYFFGFGLPLALATSYPDSIMFSGGLFAFLFPYFILSAHNAHVMGHGGGRKPLPFSWFKPTILLSNVFFAKVVKQKNQHLLKKKPE